MDEQFYIEKVAVLGAGVMGAQIAAHFGNAGIPVILFDLKAPNDKPANEVLNKAIAGLQKMSPKPLASSKTLNYITLANYNDNLEELKGCNLIIEAIAERLDWKESLYNKIANYVNENAILASNTSGLSIELLATALPENLRSRFCGVHFFNPPRYMPLVELIPHNNTDSSILIQLETFLVTNMGKSIITAKDTPNFIANRLGVFSMVSTCINAEKFNIPLEVVDQLTGKNLGRAKSATFRTADVVGLDIFAHVVETMAKNCHDGFEESYVIPTWIKALIEKGALGAKTKAGIFTKGKNGIEVIDLTTGKYRLADKKASKEIIDILHDNNWATKLDAIKSSDLPEAQFLWACFRDIFHYASVLLGEIADSPREMDLAIRWGFGWKEGIFEIWQQGGFSKISQWIKEDIDKKVSLGKVALPPWVFELSDGVYIENQHFNIAKNCFVSRNPLSVYSRQLFPDLVLHEVANVPIHIIYENSGVRLWHTGDDIGILSFKTKMCAIGEDVLIGLDEALAFAEEQCIAMVIWQEKDVFSVGANLEEFGFKFMMNGLDGVEEVISMGHRIVAQRLRYSKIPVIAAVKGYAFGGGCEIMLHCSGVVAALESYIGLVEAGVGLLPGWGGTTEMAYRASQALDPWHDFERRYKNLAMAQVAMSAREAQEMGFLRESDIIVMNSREVLLIAKERAKFMALSGYRPPVAAKFEVFGSQGIATVNALLVNMFAGNQISEHDLLIAKSIATVMCGGEVEKGSLVSENWMLRIEKDKFKELALTPKTADRIEHMLKTGKPLRN
ncbi:MAG: 3-hydroxyacyl-CoA dehydrogenase/enoyl-CoA hydratase family protein [Burkholderiales bacterium]|nr:3-hydroxyacyl-CoA dehydrogenase/enoyl-CoA hydratase family protein [Burkholderiales bacterium]